MGNGDSQNLLTLARRVQDALLEKARTADLSALSIESLAALRGALPVAFMAAPKKETCTCTVVSVDRDANKAAGWQCQCFKLSNPNTKMTSYKGPGFTNWVGGAAGGLSPQGNITESVVDPVSGECFLVEHTCKCEGEL